MPGHREEITLSRDTPKIPLSFPHVSSYEKNIAALFDGERNAAKFRGDLVRFAFRLDA